MSDLRFDGRVVIVTGAGGNYPSLGRVYARLFAERGAKVVVNDLGVGPDGRGIQRAHADVVAQELVDAGGEAIANTDSVATEEGAQAVVQSALDAWGRVDALVNNAGVAPLALFREISSLDVRRTVEVHLMGNIWMCRAVWPHMERAGYGRIVNITSAAQTGGRYLTIYGAAKAGIAGLTYSLAIEGDEFGIKANTLGPAALTSATTHMNDPSDFLTLFENHYPAELVAPAVGFLAHEECPVSGRYFEAGAGRVSNRWFAESKGYTNTGLTIEDVRDNFVAILEREGAEPLLDPVESAKSLTFAFKPKPYQPE
jgi:NAD(P)-dependent dehydrogenase (short-subunit alcohol dehydrogenase family)